MQCQYNSRVSKQILTGTDAIIHFRIGDNIGFLDKLMISLAGQRRDISIFTINCIIYPSIYFESKYCFLILICSNFIIYKN